MSRIIPVLILMCLCMNGCMDLVIRMEVRKDGSVSGLIKMEMLEQSYQQMAIMAKTAGTDISILEKEKMEKYLEEYDGKLNKYENSVVDGFRKIYIETDVKQGKAWINGLADDSMIIKKEGDHWAWVFLDSDMGRSMASMDPNLVEQQIAMMAPTLAGLKWKIDMVVPEIVDTNLQKVDGHTARFEIDFDQDVAEKPGPEAAKAMIRMMEPKWVHFKGLK